MSLTQEAFKELWKKQLLPEIRREFRSDSEALKQSMTELSKKFDQIETSQKYLSSQYDSILAAIGEIKKQVQHVENQTDETWSEINKMKGETYDMEVRLDELAQYSRRDCLEITGIPVVPTDNPAKLVGEVAQVIGIQLDPQDISIAHRLPSTTKVKDRLIVKITRREKRDEFYKKRAKLKTKTTKDLPTIKGQPLDVNHKAAIHVNESLTPYRKRLFGEILKFKRNNNYKYLWTVNGKINLRETDISTTHTFVSYEQLNNFRDQQESF